MAPSAIDLEWEMLLLTLRLYDNLAIPRNSIQIFVDTMMDFLKKYEAFIEQHLRCQFG